MLKVKGTASQVKSNLLIKPILFASLYDKSVEVTERPNDSPKNHTVSARDFNPDLPNFQKKPPFFPCAMLPPMVEFGKHYHIRFSAELCLFRF